MSSPLLLLHGFAGGPEMFDSVAPSGRARLAPSLTGHGGLEPSDWAQSFDDEIVRIARLIRTEKSGAVHVVGYSLGARVALGLLVREPALVSRATLIGVHPGLGSEAQRRARRERDRRFIDLLISEGIERFVAAWETEAVFATQSRLSGELVARQRQVRLGHSARGLAHAMATLGLAEMPDFWPFLPAIDRPVTLVVGAEDQKFHELARDIHALVTHSRLIVEARCGHNVVLEAPELIRRVLDTATEFS
jgi:2-succinyl-6-hydroxy-2,4-cyclohexadiene-1-carboxylate synthase